MDPADLRFLARASMEPLEHDLVEIDGAIELVRSGTATRVGLIGLIAPDRVAGVALARAQAAGVELAIDRTNSTPAITIGPRH